ncbi:MAG: TonB-dependent receptor [Spirochaetes bacterium]|nr:TonB-dependent receptor [Spirochaetota bacterium]
MRKKGLAFLLSLVLLLPAAVPAQEGEPPGDYDEDWHWIWEAEGITVTGTRIPRRLADSPVAVEVISAEEIENSTAVTVVDVLEAHGIVHNAGGAMGDGVSLQGMGEGRVLFLIDGRRVSGRTGQRLVGAALPLGNVERIEIVRGPQSVLFGSDAIGGVINVITRRPQDRVTFTSSVTNRFLLPHNDPDTGGSPAAGFNPAREQNIAATLGFPLGVARNTFDAEFSRGDFHYNEAATFSLLPRFLRGRAGLNTGIPLSYDLELTVGSSVMLLREDEQLDVFGSLDRRTWMRVDSHAELQWFPSDSAMLNFRLYNSYYQRNWDMLNALTDTWTAGDRFENDNIVAAEVVGSWLFRPRLMFTGGVESSLSTMRQYNLAESFVMMDRQAVFLQAELFEPGGYSLVAGLRVERNSRFGVAAAPRLSAMTHLGGGFRGFASTGLAFRAPDFSDLYMDMGPQHVPGHAVVRGNPELTPEFSFGSSAGLEWSGDRGFSQINIFHHELWDEMADVFFPGLGIAGENIRMNIDRTMRTGIDAESRVNLPFNTFVSAGYGWVFAWDRGAGERLHLQPAHTVRARAGVDLPSPGLSSFLQARWLSAVDTVDARFLLDFFFTYRISENFRFNLGIDNITGELNPLGPATRQSFSLGIVYTL